MAFATKHEKKPVAPPPYTVTLELSHEEAEVLRGVLSKIGGLPHGTWRQYTDHINQVLQEAGVRYVRLPAEGMQHSIYATGRFPKPSEDE